jgi:hypothetical protein
MVTVLDVAFALIALGVGLMTFVGACGLLYVSVRLWWRS